MTTQLTIQTPAHTVKTAGMWCVLSLSVEERSSARYLGSKQTLIQASAFTARNPRNPEADHTKAALD